MDKQNSLDKESTILLKYTFLNFKKPKYPNSTITSPLQPDWSKVIDLAVYHKILPLLYHGVKKFDDIPEKILHSLKKKYRQTAAKNLLTTSTLLTILDLFGKNSIEAIPFKGPVLTEMIYGDLSLRTFNDLDILISRKSLRRAINLLFQQGFLPDIALNTDQFIKLAEKGHHATVFRDNIVIELHWELTGRYFAKAVTLESLQPRVVQTALAGKTVQTFAAEDLFIYLCVHGCRHHWQQLDAVCCVAGLIQAQPALDWRAVKDLSTKQGSGKMVALGLLLIQKLLETELPAGARMITAKYPHLKKTTRMISRRLFPKGDNYQSRFSYFQDVKFHYAVMSSHFDWVRYCIRPLLNPTHSDWLWIRLPAALSIIYYFFRPLRLLIKYLRKHLL